MLLRMLVVFPLAEREVFDKATCKTSLGPRMMIRGPGLSDLLDDGFIVRADATRGHSLIRFARICSSCSWVIPSACWA
jgi:hypothetical protein